ncbi:hypothetical protein HHK36_023123 [Tetracentron sinense]|uniref:C3H1-type domain-containing protein n=1 Tax=Tetracentron sinense TaxID=13715 RepID=A0A834YKR0_TETSI|nr:hypothetical protein HHK36_023123 [Tetracentron sinense]
MPALYFFDHCLRASNQALKSLILAAKEDNVLLEMLQKCLGLCLGDGDDSQKVGVWSTIENSVGIVPLIATSESLPERPGEPDCPYFLKTQKCKFGFRCKFNHPKENIGALVGAISVEGASENVDFSAFPERPTEPPCSFYMKTGKCKFGVSCKFHHPKDIQIPSAEQENVNREQTDNGEQTESVVKDDGTTTGDVNLVKPFVSFTPALLHNSKGLPIRPGEVDCPFYLKTGSCKYSATCRYNHPDRNFMNPSVAATLGHAIVNSAAANLNIGVINPAASMLPTIDPRLAQTTLGMGPTIYPQRPGQMECDGAIICPFYMKTGTCKYGVTCRFDHPPPGEAIAMATVQGTGGGEETETTQEQQE